MTTRSPIVAPNIRTINTLLRGIHLLISFSALISIVQFACAIVGCVQSGDVVNAEILFTLAQKEFHVEFDMSSWEYLVSLQCQALRLDKVLPLMGRLKDMSFPAAGSQYVQ